MSDHSHLQQQLEMADHLMQIASKEELVECARLIALNLAQYEMKYGVMPTDEATPPTSHSDPAELPMDLVIKGMETLVLVLGGVISGFDSTTRH